MDNKKIPRVVISGWYGNKNIGDEAILASMISALRKNVKEIEITVLSDDPDYSRRIHKVNAVYQLPFGFIPLASAILRGKFFKTIISLWKSNLFILGGGGFLSDWQSWTVILFWLGQVVLAKIFMTKVMLYGIGAGPITTRRGRILTRLILNKLVNAITVRDIISKDWLVKAGVKKQIHVTADPAINLEPVDLSRVTEIMIQQKIGLAPLTIGVSFAPLFHIEKFWPRKHHKYINYRNACAQIIDYLISRLDTHVVFIPMQPSVDIPFASDVITNLKNQEKVHILRGEYAPQEIMGIIEKMDMIIGIRFHSLIFSAVMYVPIIAVVIHHKTWCFLSQINQEDMSVGLGDGTNWEDMDIDVNKVIKLIDKVWAERIEIKQELKQQIRPLRKCESANIEVLLDLLGT